MPKKQVKEKKKSHIVVYGDDKDQTVSKAVWSFLPHNYIEIKASRQEDELKQVARHSLLNLIVIEDEHDKNCSLAKSLSTDPSVLGDIAAIIKNTVSEEQRLTIMAYGFDAIFDLDFVSSKELKMVLSNKLEKAEIRLTHREQGLEYQRFKMALDSAPEAFVIFDENKRLFFVSEHYRNAYPESIDKLIVGTPLVDVYEMLAVEQGVNKDDPRYAIMEQFWINLDGEEEFVLDDGRIWRVRATPLPDGCGSIVMTSDITEFHKQKKMLEQQSKRLKAALKESQEANNLQQQFISMVSHEFRTPLTIIDGNIQLIELKGHALDKEKLQKRCKTIRNAISRLVYTMEGVLSSSMLTSGNFNIIKEVFDIKSLISEMSYEYEDLTDCTKINLEIEKLPDHVKLDKKVVTLTLSNLLSNAVKYSKGDADITILGYHETNTIVLEIEDKGVGIPEEELEHIFKRYYRASTSTGISGTGIGLHLTHDLVNLHGGSITVESALQKGTKFVVKLPLFD